MAQREKLVDQAQQLRLDSQQVRLQYLQAAIASAVMLCTSAECDVRMGNLAHARRLVTRLTRCIFEISRRMEQLPADADGPRNELRVKLTHVEERIRLLYDSTSEERVPLGGRAVDKQPPHRQGTSSSGNSHYRDKGVKSG